MGVILGAACEQPALIVAGVKHLQAVADIVNQMVQINLVHDKPIRRDAVEAFREDAEAEILPRMLAACSLNLNGPGVLCL